MPSIPRAARSKHDAGCIRRKNTTGTPYLCTCGLSDEEVAAGTSPAMTQPQPSHNERVERAARRASGFLGTIPWDDLPERNPEGQVDDPVLYRWDYYGLAEAMLAAADGEPS